MGQLKYLDNEARMRLDLLIKDALRNNKCGCNLLFVTDIDAIEFHNGRPVAVVDYKVGSHWVLDVSNEVQMRVALSLRAHFPVVRYWVVEYDEALEQWTIYQVDAPRVTNPAGFLSYRDFTLTLRSQGDHRALEQWRHQVHGLTCFKEAS